MSFLLHADARFVSQRLPRVRGQLLTEDIIDALARFSNLLVAAKEGRPIAELRFPMEKRPFAPGE
jgi:hypothetical protein